MFCEDIPRFANLFGITTNVENSDRVPLCNLIFLFVFILIIFVIGGPRGTEEYREGNLYLRYRFGTSFRLKRRNSDKDTQLTMSYDIYPHKSLVYMLITDKSWLITHNYR